MSWWRPFGWARRTAPDEHAVRWIAVGWVAHQPEAEMFLEILRGEGIPAFARRPAAVDVPDMLAGGPREILVPAEHEELARGLLAPLPPDERYAADRGDGR